MDSKYFPLSSRQLDIYFDQIAYPDTPVYNIGGFLIMYGEVDFNLLEKAIQQLVAESDAFRLLFAMQNNEPVQFINNKIKGLLSFIDYSNSHKSNELTQTYLNQQFSIAFDISSAKPLWQFVLFKELHKRFK